MSAGQSIANNLPIASTHDKISLSVLLETAAQKSYHELVTMIELSQNKTSLERKKELVKFACRTRQLFIRLLGVVKWAATAGKVHACEDIQNVLERHALLLRDTSDALAHLAREKLVNMRLTNYPLTDAVDTLTLGSVNYLPERISEATAPFIPVTEHERRQILPRLQQILTARLAIAELPIQFNNVVIRNGLVTLSVDGEFQVTMGVTNDNLFSHWHIYKTKLFLRDPEEPEQELVHPSQMQALTNYIQSWLIESENPFVELYRYLHYYCQSLRLQILYEQAQRIRNRSLKQKHLHLSNYVPCKSLQIEYWKESNALNPNRKSINTEKQRDVSLTIVCDDDGKFQLIHWPPLSVEDSVIISQILEKPNFTLEEILHRTIFVRSQRRFEDLKGNLISITSAKIDIDLLVPALKCEFLPESRTEEILFISIRPFSGLYKVVSYMETRFCLQIEHALNRDQNNLVEAINLFKIWLIQQRIPSLLAHTSTRVYTRLPSLNIKNDLVAPFINNSVFIELLHNEGYYILVHISDPNQLLVQYYLLIVEKRSSSHDQLVLQQQQSQQNPSYNQTTQVNDEFAKWIIEPLVICALDPTAFLRKELIELKSITQINKSKDKIADERGMKCARPAPILSLKLLLKLVNYYDEMLSYTFLKEDFQRKKTICKGIIYSPWTGIPQLDIVRTSICDDSLSSTAELINYVNECFWPRLTLSTVRLTYLFRDMHFANKLVERQWVLHLQFPDRNYFHNSSVSTPYNAIISSHHLPWKVYSKMVDYVHHELRCAFELTHLFESYSSSFLESTDLRAITDIGSFDFFKCSIYYGPNLNFNITLLPRIQTNATENNSHQSHLFDLRYTNLNSKFLLTTHQILNAKITRFLARTRSLKQFLRLLHMTAIPIALIGRLNCYNRPVVISNQGLSSPLLSFVPYTETRWRLVFGQYFALDIQICGPNLILVRDGAYSVQLNSSLPDLVPIPRIKDFLSKFADDRGLTYEFTHITDRLRDRDFLLPELQLPVPNTAGTSNAPSLVRSLPIGNAPTPQLLHPVGTPNPSFNSLTPGSTGPASQQQQPVNSPSQPIISPSPNMMGNSPQMPVTGSPMPAQNMPQMNGPGSVGMPNPSPGMPFDIAYPSPGMRTSVFPVTLMGPSPETPGNTINSAAATPSNIRPEEYNTKSTSSHSYNRCLSSKPSYPVYMSQQSFFRMLYTSDGRQWSKLETFLASSILIKQFSRAVHDSNDQNHQSIRAVPNEFDTYRIEHLSLQIAFPLDSQTLTYRMQLTSCGDASSQQPSNVNWGVDDLSTVETFLNQAFFPSTVGPDGVHIAAAPSIDILSLNVNQNRSSVISSLHKMFSTINPRVLRDLIKVIKLEKNADQIHSWRVQWCLTYPHGVSFLSPGAPAVHITPQLSLILMFRLTSIRHRNDMHMMSNHGMLPPISFVVPLQHDIQNNQTTLVEKIIKCSPSNEQRYQNINKILSNSRDNNSKYECSLYPSIYEIVNQLPFQ